MRVIDENTKRASGLEPVQSGDIRKVLEAISALLSGGCRSRKFLGELRQSVKRSGAGYVMTSRQLDTLNAMLSKHGFERVGCAVYDSQKKRARYESVTTNINSEFATLVASRPLKPPGRK